MLEQLKDVLKSLKWTEGQTLVYCTLVEKGAMKPADLVIHAGVAQGKIYSILEELERSKGAVIKSGSRPTKYDAQNPRHVLNKMISDVEQMKESALQQGAEEFYEKRYDQMVEKTICWTVQGISGVLIQLRSFIGDCDSSLKISDPDLNWIGSSEYKILEKLLRERKTVKIIGTPVFQEVLEDLQSKGADVRMCDKLLPYYLIDDKISLMRFHLPDCGTVIKDSVFVDSKVSEFESNFKRGKKLGGEQIET